MESDHKFTGTVFFFGTLLLVSDQIYRLYKFQDGYDAGNKANYLLYDGYFFSIYYAFGTVLYFSLVGVLLLNPSPTSIFWRLLFPILSFTFFAECEALLEFFLHVSEIADHLSMTSWNLNMFLAFLAMGVFRWTVANIMIKQMFVLDKDIIRGGYGLIPSKSKSLFIFPVIMLMNVV